MVKEKTNKIHVHFLSSLSGSIWEISSQLTPQFKKHFNLTCEFSNEIPQKKEVLLLHFLDPAIIEHREFECFKKKILIQPIDGTILTERAIRLLNKFDLIICPAHASKNILKQNKVIIPIKVIPNYYLSSLFEEAKDDQKINKYIPNDKFIFYHESTLHPRKGIEFLYEGFVKAFSDTKYVDDVVLMIKDNQYNIGNFKKIEKIKRNTIKLQNEYVKPANIIKFSSYLDEEELKVLWANADCYATMAKIEGFGIPMLRFNMLRKPILCLDNFNSGYNDYLKNGLDCEMIPTKQKIAKDEFMWLYEKETEWAEPNIDDVVDGFRYCFEHYYEMRKDLFFMQKKYELKKKEYQFETIVDSYVRNIVECFNS